MDARRHHRRRRGDAPNSPEREGGSLAGSRASGGDHGAAAGADGDEMFEYSYSYTDASLSGDGAHFDIYEEQVSALVFFFFFFFFFLVSKSSSTLIANITPQAARSGAGSPEAATGGLSGILTRLIAGFVPSPGR